MHFWEDGAIFTISFPELCQLTQMFITRYDSEFSICVSVVIVL